MKGLEQRLALVAGLKRVVSFGAIALLTVALILLGANIPQPSDLYAARTDKAVSLFHPSAAIAQVRLREVPQDVYLRLPNLPKENHYVSAVSGEPLPENTLVSRMIQYHAYKKGRPPSLRFDWKLTIADYLEANEYINPVNYPGQGTLTEHPLVGDRAAIKGLTRAERSQLVEVLVSLFNPNRSRNSTSSGTANTSSPSTSSSPTNFPDAPKPGDAQLLVP